MTIRIVPGSPEQAIRSPYSTTKPPVRLQLRNRKHEKVKCDALSWLEIAVA